MCVWVMFMLLVFLGPLLTMPGTVQAQPKGMAIEGIGYNVNASMAENLKSLSGKKVSVTLDSGKTITGVIKAIGDHLLHVEKIEGREYFDALIRMESIGAIDTRFRTEQR